MSASKAKPSPLDELKSAADAVWGKIEAGELTTHAQIMEIVKYERAACASWGTKKEEKEK